MTGPSHWYIVERGGLLRALLLSLNMNSTYCIDETSCNRIEANELALASGGVYMLKQERIANGLPTGILDNLIRK